MKTLLTIVCISFAIAAQAASLNFLAGSNSTVRVTNTANGVDVEISGTAVGEVTTAQLNSSSNSLYLAMLGNGTTVSNSCVQFTLSASNSLYVISSNIAVAVSSAVPAGSSNFSQVQMVAPVSRILLQSGGGQDTLDFQSADGSGTTNTHVRLAYDYLDEALTYTEIFGQLRIQDANAVVGYVLACTNANGAGTWSAHYDLPQTNAIAYGFRVSYDGVTFRDGGGNERVTIYADNSDYGALVISNRFSGDFAKLFGTVVLPQSLARMQDTTNKVIVIQATNIVDSAGSAGSTDHVLKKSAAGTTWAAPEVPLSLLLSVSNNVFTNLMGQLTNPPAMTVGDLQVTGSVSMADLTVTNGTKLVTGVSYVGTNDAAVSNLTLALGRGSQTIYLSNNVTLTNFTGLSDDGLEDGLLVRLIPIGTVRTVTYPTFGAASYSTYLHTNSNNTIWTSLTNGVEYLWSVSRRGTNLYSVITAWF